MAQISQVFLDKIKRSIAKSQLGVGEFRRVVGSGSHFVSLEATYGKEPYFFSLQIDGTTIYVHKIRREESGKV